MINDKELLFAQMNQGAIVITPNNRLSNQLLRDVYLQHKSTMTKPACLPYQSFLRNLFNRARHQYVTEQHPLLIGTIQQRFLWREIIKNQQAYPCNEGLLHEIQDAWTRCKNWNICNDHPSFALTSQTQQFQQWQQQFQQRLTNMGAITEEQLANQVLRYPDLLKAETLIWACFDDYTPQQLLLQQTLEANGCQQAHFDWAPKPTTQAFQYRANDRQEESLQMIDWLKSRLAAGETRIGVVIPDLQAQHQQLQRLLQRHISPNHFSISLGKALFDIPLVAHAINWLSLDKQTVTHHQVRLLLQSPYLAFSKTESVARAQAIQDSKLLKEAVIPFAFMLQTLTLDTPKLATTLNNLTDYPKQASPAEWIDIFKTRLITLGFPGEYPLNSTTYQCFQRFLTLFDELLQLSITSPILNQKQALETLVDLTKSTVFQPKKSVTKIQILGLLEASGCTFDSVWVSGLTDQCLPQKTNLSAFIPLDLQRTLQMPHAIAARELQFAQQLLGRLQNASHHVIFSYPQLIGDMPNLPSPLITHLPAFFPLELTRPTTSHSLINVEEQYSLPLAPTEGVSGGTTLLANQAKCPFRALAAHRLHARSGPDISSGPDASERGQVLHQVMEILWKRLGSQQQLLSLTTPVLNEYIEHAIITALESLTQNRPLSFSHLIQEVEFSRIKRLILTCLDWEKQRSPFVIESLEQTFIIELAGILFKVRIDRLDNVGPDKKWVIDYKSSMPVNKPWNENRPEAPQLLLYALLDQSINALLFVQLNAGQLTCNGLSEDKLPMKGVSTMKKNEQWRDYQQHWHQQLTELADEFRTGFCPPRPSRASICTRCEFHNLCRIE